ncbi:MAG: WXG100 family type VII secretion target [Clostridiales Family XIII bacterium]|jgi:WXG100 family type VII secretion target|nr:WXG100 family type VII secretion target [Clostridiales Family XIII bacterium]
MAQDNSIRISTQTLRDTAEFVRTRNEQLETLLNEVRSKIAHLCDGTWQSDAGEEIQRKITAFGNNHFKPYKEVVESYAQYLVTTAEQYETTESGIQSSAAAFQE